MIPLMSISRNFFLGREPLKGFFPFTRFDKEKANTVSRQAIADIGIDIRDPTQAVGTLSGGERQSVAIARAIHFGAKVLILDEPTSALGVHQAAMVLKFVIEARLRGLAVIFISHNIHHAYPVGDVFTLLNRGRAAGHVPQVGDHPRRGGGDHVGRRGPEGGRGRDRRAARLDPRQGHASPGGVRLPLPAESPDPPADRVDL